MPFQQLGAGCEPRIYRLGEYFAPEEIKRATSNCCLGRLERGLPVLRMRSRAGGSSAGRCASSTAWT